MKKKITEMALYAALFVALMVVSVLLTEGVLRLILLAVLYFVETEILVSMVRLVLHEPEPVKRTQEEMIRAENQWYHERQDPALMPRMRPVGYVLWGVTFLLVLTGFITVGPYWLHSVACVLCFAACVILCAVFPAYFSFNYMEGEKDVGYTFRIVNVLVPMFLSLAAGTFRALTQFCFVDWMALLEGMLLLTAACGVVLRLAVPEFRRVTSSWVGAVLFVLIFSLGLAAPVNHLLEPPPVTIMVTVEEYNPGAGKNPPDYTLRLDNGEAINMPANDGFSQRRFWIGQRVKVEYHEGGLGIDYYCYPEE